VSSDVSIESWLDSEGYGLPPSRAQARAALEEAQLTRAGKTRMSQEKLDRSRTVLKGRFFLHCEATACRALATQSGRTPLSASTKTHCEGCSGSDNRRVEGSFLEACRRHGVSKLVIVGGSPSVREELERSLGKTLHLRLVDGTERRTEDRSRADAEWADLLLVWGASELHHKVSWHYTQLPAPLRHKVVHVVKRGVAALLSEGIAHLDRSTGR
jgi:hypothetical protein